MIGTSTLYFIFRYRKAFIDPPPEKPKKEEEKKGNAKIQDGAARFDRMDLVHLTAKYLRCNQG